MTVKAAAMLGREDHEGTETLGLALRFAKPFEDAVSPRSEWRLNGVVLRDAETRAWKARIGVAMLVSLLHLLLAIRAIARSWSGRFWLGVVGGLLRVGAMLVTVIVAFKQGAIFMLGGISLHLQGGDEPSAVALLAALFVGIAAPILSLVVAGVAYRRFQDVPMAREEELQRPFAAWLPVAIFDAVNLAFALAGAML